MRSEKKIIYAALFTGSVIFISGVSTLPPNASYDSPSFITAMVGSGIAFVFAVYLLSISCWRKESAPSALTKRIRRISNHDILKLSEKSQKIMKPLGQRRRSSGLKNPIIKSMRVEPADK